MPRIPDHKLGDDPGDRIDRAGAQLLCGRRCRGCSAAGQRDMWRVVVAFKPVDHPKGVGERAVNPMEPGALNAKIDDRAVAAWWLLEGVDPGDLGFDGRQPADHRSQPFLQRRQLVFGVAVRQLRLGKPLDHERVVVPNLLEIEQPRLEIGCEPLDGPGDGNVEAEHSRTRVCGRKNASVASPPV